MVLVVQSNASHLSKSKAHSQAGGRFFMSSDTKDPAKNGAVLNIAQLIRSVVSLAAEAKPGALYMNARKSKQKWGTHNHPCQCK
jgi:hypothetical protein